MKLVLRCLVCLAFLSTSIILIVQGILRVFGYIGINRYVDGIVLIIFGLLFLTRGIMSLSILIFDFKLIKEIGYKDFLEAVKDSSIHAIFPFFINKGKAKKGQSNDS